MKKEVFEELLESGEAGCRDYERQNEALRTFGMR